MVCYVTLLPTSLHHGTKLLQCLCQADSRNMPLNVIVVGAGIAGLCAAVALHQVGHDITVGRVMSPYQVNS